jgi:hypothetical protein
MAQKSTIPKSTIPERGFSAPKQLQNWLNSLSEEKTVIFARIIASRAAQRVLPNISKLFELESDTAKWRFKLTLTTLRCNTVSKVASLSVTREIDDNLRGAAISAVRSANSAFSEPSNLFADLSAANSANSAFSAISALHTDHAALSANSAADSVDKSAFSAVDNAVRSGVFPAVWAAVTADARALEAGATPEDMAARPLWPEESPYKPHFDRKTFLAAAPSFEVWLDWYEPIVEGKAPWGLQCDVANKLETRIALGDGRGEGGKDFWERDADEVNAEIKGWVEAARAEMVAAMHQPVDIEDEQVFAQRPAPHQFEEIDGKIIALPMKSNRREDDFAKDMWDELIAKANATRDRLERSQSPRHIIDAFDRLIAGLGNTFEEVRPGKLLMQSNTIETVAASYDTPEMRGELAADCLSLVKDLSESLTDFKALFPEILDIEAMRLAQKIAGDSTNAILVQTRKIAVIAAESDSVDQSVSDAFNAAFAEIEEQERLAAEGQNDLAIAAANTKKAETAALHTLDIRNFVARVLKSRPAKLIGKVATDYTEDFYKGSRKGMEKLGENSVRAAITTIVFYLAGPVAALALLLHSFNPLAKKAAEIEADDPGKIGPQ